MSKLARGKTARSKTLASLPCLEGGFVFFYLPFANLSFAPYAYIFTTSSVPAKDDDQRVNHSWNEKQKR